MEQKTIEEQMHRLEQILSFTFKNINHLSQAMCAIKKDKNNLANESLALVGDTLLKFVLADYIYSKKPDSTKKDITEIKIEAEQNTTLNKIEKKNQILSSLFIISVVMLAASLLMYNVENQAQPESFDNAFSGIWWAVSTILTIGYGDIYPITVMGKLLGVVIAFLGVFAVALPTGIISAGFVEQYQEMKAEEKSGSVDSEIPIHNVVIDIDSMWIGKSLKELEEEFGLMLILVRRGKKTVKPTEKYHVEVGDMLVLYYMPTKVS